MINKNFSKLFEKKEYVVNKLNIDLKKRPEELSNETFYRIAQEYENLTN
jgi:16S rRNA A1518/A1519 N6-dimethyltransferase RsmA/KsgA/DIM1 with predicted DNA glycosylase/AP lyase activity